MISKKDIDAYHSITAPPELKQRILKENKASRLRRRSFSSFARAGAAAACIVLFAFLAYTRFINVFGIKVSLGENPIEASGQFLTGGTAVARGGEVILSGSNVSLPLDFSVKGDAEVSVSEGTLSRFVNGVESSLGSAASINEDTQLIWNLELSEHKASPQMTVKGQRSHASYIISFDKEAGQWIILKK